MVGLRYPLRDLLGSIPSLPNTSWKGVVCWCMFLGSKYRRFCGNPSQPGNLIFPPAATDSAQESLLPTSQHASRVGMACNHVNQLYNFLAYKYTVYCRKMIGLIGASHMTGSWQGHESSISYDVCFLSLVFDVLRLCSRHTRLLLKSWGTAEHQADTES